MGEHSRFPQKAPVLPAPAILPIITKHTNPGPVNEPRVLPPLPTLTVVLPSEHSNVSVAELTSLSMNDDAESLEKILAGLNSLDSEIREAAVQFGDRTAASKLREAAAITASPAEKNALLEAADHLELPPLEIRATNASPSRR